MDELQSRKLQARFVAFKENLPAGDAKDLYVTMFNNLLTEIMSETGLALSEFLIPDSLLRPHVLYVDNHPIRGKSVGMSDAKYCERAYFLMQLDAAILLFSSSLDAGRRSVGF